jgi:hypothetical protein
MPSPAALMAKDFDNVIARCREVLPLVDAIEAAPAKLVALQSEVARIGAETNHLRQTLASEKSAWLEEWKSLKAEGERHRLEHELDEKEWLAKLDAARASLLAVQNKVGKEHAKLEKIVKEIRRLQRSAH